MTKNHTRSEAGFSLIEVLVATAIMLVVTGGIFTVLNPSGAMFKAQPEVVVSRLLWAAGYHQPPTYYVAHFQIEKDGTRIEQEILVARESQLTQVCWRLLGQRKSVRLFVRPFLSGASTRALWASSTAATSRCPSAAARCSGVSPARS